MRRCKALSQPAVMPALLVFALSAAVYLPTLSYPFTNWDDLLLVTENPLIRDVSVRNLRDIFTSVYAHDYWPLSLASLALDRLLWGFNPTGYHLTNLILHGVNAALVYLLLVRLAGNGLPALLGALWFGLHPLQVESVAWVAERKNVLSQAFVLAAVLAYLRAGALGTAAEDGTRRGAYLASLALFAGALLSKTSTVVLPAILVALHLCLGRPRLVLTLPHFVLAALGSLVTLLSKAEFVQTYPAGSFAAALLTLPTLLATYVAKLLFPVQLNALYDFIPVRGPATVKFWIALALLAGVALLMRSLWRWERRALFGLAWLFLAFLPVLNLVPFPILFAERFAYLPSVGLAIFGVCVGSRLTGAGAPLPPTPAAAHLAARGSDAGLPSAEARTAGGLLRRAVPGGAAVCLALLGFLTLSRGRVWADSMSLWQDVIRKSPRLSVPHHNLGADYRQRGQQNRAAAEYLTALALKPGHPESQMNLGNLHLEGGRLDRAILHYQRELSHFPRSAMAYGNLGVAYNRKGRAERAATAFERAQALNPREPRLLVKLGNAYAQQRRYHLALLRLQEALQRSPRLLRRDAELANLLGTIYGRLGEPRRAAAFYAGALQRDPTLPAGFINLANAFDALEQHDRALHAAYAAAALAPDLTEALTNLGALLGAVGRPLRAERFLRAGLRRAPGTAKARLALARAFQEAGRSDKAMLAVKAELRGDPRLGQGWTQLGDLYAAQSRPHQAAGAYRVAGRLDATDPSAWNRLGYLWHQHGTPDRAGAAYLQALALLAGPLRQPPATPASPSARIAQRLAAHANQVARAWSNFGAIAASRGRGDRARQALQRALHLDPAYEPAHLNLGSLLSRQERYDAALRQFALAMRLNPSRTESAFNMASMLEVRGQARQALHWYEYFREHWQGAASLDSVAAQKIAQLRAHLE